MAIVICRWYLSQNRVLCPDKGTLRTQLTPFQDEISDIRTISMHYLTCTKKWWTVEIVLNLGQAVVPRDRRKTKVEDKAFSPITDITEMKRRGSLYCRLVLYDDSWKNEEHRGKKVGWAKLGQIKVLWPHFTNNLSSTVSPRSSQCHQRT